MTSTRVVASGNSLMLQTQVVASYTVTGARTTAGVVNAYSAVGQGAAYMQGGPGCGGRSKPVNLPLRNAIQIDMDHIASGHMQGGARVSPNKDLFPSGWSRSDVQRAIRDAYSNAKRIATQGDRVLVQGNSGGRTIEMWVNTVTKTIETAYPAGG